MLKEALLRLSVAFALVTGVAIPAAHAQLARVGPALAASDGYPAWYQDKTGLALEFCKATTQAELNGGWCLILPSNFPSGAVPEVAFTNYSPEHFYWNATAGARRPQGVPGAILVLSMEGAFANNDPIAGDQIVFGRLRIVIPSIPASGDYKVYTPFGDFSFPNQVAGDRLFFTSDIGFGCGSDFSCALNSLIGPFLLPSPAPGGLEVPPMPDLAASPGLDPFYQVLVNTGATTPLPGTGKRYLADPARLGPVTGSPLPPFVGSDGQTYNHNIFRVEGPAGVLISETNFSVAGRVMEGTIAAQLKINRASYAATATAAGIVNKLDVFATATPSLRPRVPAAPVAGAAPSDLGFFDAPCATDPTTGAVIGPPNVAGLLYYQMYSDGAGTWWGSNNPATIPPQVCVQDKAAKNAAGQVVTAYIMGDVTDEVHINWAQVMWDPSVGGGTLNVSAATSDQVNQPVLTLSGYTVPDPNNLGARIPAVIPSGGTLTISEVGAAPAKVTVVSTRGGVASMDTTTGSGIPISTTHPTANADAATTAEDTPLSSFNVLANDILNGAAVVAVQITAQGGLGTATLNPDNTLNYAPNLNVNGTDLIGYTVTGDGAVSNEGYLTVIITPVNDAPIANPDSIGAPNNRGVTFNLLGNDVDPDGAADLKAAVIASLPTIDVVLTCNGGQAVAVGTVCLGGSATLLATKAGAFTFTYYAQDQAGLQSVNPATVTLNATAAETVAIAKAIFTGKSLRWTVGGTDSVAAGQTLSITYTGGTYKINGACTGSAAGFQIGTAPVDGLGNWTFDQIVNSAGMINPTNTGANSTGFWCSPPKQVLVSSTLGGTSTANIAFK